MLKKIVPFIVVLTLLVSLFAIPVSAAETEGNYINLLDYCSMDGSYNSFTLNGSHSGAYRFGDILGPLSIYGIELTVTYSGDVAPSVDSISLYNSSASRSEIITPIVRNPADSILRVRGSFNCYLGESISVHFTSSTETNVNIVSFNVYLSGSADIPIASQIWDGSTNRTLSFNPNEGGYIDFDYTGSASRNNLCEIRVDDWRNFDELSFYGAVDCHSISSITAILRSNVSDSYQTLPLTTNYINGSSGGYSPIYYYSLSVDLTDISHADYVDSTVIIRFSVNYMPSQLWGSFALYDCHGSIFMGSVDYEDKINALMFGVLNDLYNSFEGFGELYLYVYEYYNVPMLQYVGAGFQSVIEKLDALVKGESFDDAVNDDMNSAGDKMEDMSNQMAAGTPNITPEDVNVNIDSLVSAGGMSSATSLAAVITEQPMVSSMLVIVISLALVGFVFFGKR